MKYIVFIILISFTSLADTEVMLSIPEDSAVVGRVLPDVTVTDEDGNTFSLYESHDKGKPIIFMPMFTRCVATCPMNIHHLMDTVKKNSSSSFDVILFSFDPRDKSKDLKNFRHNMKLPRNWKLFTASPNNTHFILESLGFKFMSQDGQFIHPNVTAVLTSSYKIKRYFTDLKYSADVLMTAVNEAREIRKTWDNIRVLILPLVLILASLLIMVNYKKDESPKTFNENNI